jgi:alpha-L-rhamnosidase
MTSTFTTSDPMLNQLQRNITWSQRGNFLSIPTDCPQRDERMGWTGDAQIFARTAAFNADVAGFFTKWLHDVSDAQRDGGAYPDVVPDVCCGAGTAGWGDAGVVVPWTVYRVYGDTRVIEEHYDDMVAWVAYLQANSDGLLRPASGYGDWLNIDDETPKDVIATAYFAHSTDLLGRMAAAIGRTEDAETYRQLHADIATAFIDAYVHPDGTVEGDTQTAYVLALHMDLLPDELREEAAAHLVRNIEERDWHLSTGFLGTRDLMSVLTEAGHLDVAYRLLGNDTFPSWGYPIVHGDATTMWERWDSLKPDGTYQNPEMTSFNHYAYGAVGEWMYRYIGGIDLDPDAPAYTRMVIRPRPGGHLTSASTSYDSVHGTIATDWSIEGERLRLTVTVPANTTATVHVPTSDPASVTESGQPAADADGVRVLGSDATSAIYEVGSGTYEFRSAW